MYIHAALVAGKPCPLSCNDNHFSRDIGFTDYSHIFEQGILSGLDYEYEFKKSNKIYINTC